jgi:hypothetical protein
VAAHEGINWDQFSESYEMGHAPYLAGTHAEASVEEWSHPNPGAKKWPTKYINEVKDRRGEAYQNMQQHLKYEVNLPDQVQVTHRGEVPKGAKVRSGSIYPNWTGRNPEGVHHFGQGKKLHIYLVPREHIIGVGHEGEGEVFFDEGSKPRKPKKAK